MTALGQIPGLVAVTSKYDYFSLYQPSVYKDLEPLLAFPVGVGLITTWYAHKFPAKAVPILATLMVALAALVAAIFFGFQANNVIHSLNWALSYCVIAIFAAILYRVIADMLA